MNIQIKTCISPNFTSDDVDGTFDRAVDIFEDRMKGWFLNWAEDLYKRPHAGLATLHLLFSYFETISIYQRGEDSHNKSRLFFKEGFLSVFPNILSWQSDIRKEALTILYEHGRCGFYHNGMSKKGIMILDQNEPNFPKDTIFSYNPQYQIVFIDLNKFMPAIKAHFDTYIRRLKSGDIKAKENFEKALQILSR
ncbi:MAG TPA: hypothetical protein VG603_11695 [Chitinophagales bacterium]|nr:hypothetical protein [Chitinophagales bacterium]